VSFSGADFSATDVMAQVGGGVAVPLNKRVSAVGQLAYRRIFTKDPGTNSIRFVGSIRFMVKMSPRLDLLIGPYFLVGRAGTVDDFLVRQSLAVPPGSTDFNNLPNSLGFRNGQKSTTQRNKSKDSLTRISKLVCDPVQTCSQPQCSLRRRQEVPNIGTARPPRTSRARGTF